ncbi:MAG: tRNA (adenosine(37)-N6)-threonylcarbamoyltransferase complex dimerization subunit type 1 TsaB [Propioniciclava sp.]
MTLTLGLDTSTVVCAGIAGTGQTLLTAMVPDARAHAEQLMPLVAQVLADAGLVAAQLSRIAVGVGPGPFTGLRVGVVTALTLGEVLQIPVRGVCSLDVIAAQWTGPGQGDASAAPDEFVVVSDARRREVYWARYAGGSRQGEPQVSAPDQVPALPVAGPGAALVGVASGPTDLDAGILARVGFDLPDVGTEPLYLRRPDAEVPSAPKSALPQARLSFGRRQ